MLIIYTINSNSKKYNMKLQTIVEDISFVPINNITSEYQYIAIEANDEFPDELYHTLNMIGHGNDVYFSINRLLGWISYKIDSDTFILMEVQSDVMSMTSAVFWQHLDVDQQELIKKYRSRLENKYRRWIDDALHYVETILPHNIRQIVVDFNMNNLEKGMRYAKIESVLLRNGYNKKGKFPSKFIKRLK